MNGNLKDFFWFFGDLKVILWGLIGDESEGFYDEFIDFLFTNRGQVLVGLNFKEKHISWDTVYNELELNSSWGKSSTRDRN